jgi:hypothetical protein
LTAARRSQRAARAAAQNPIQRTNPPNLSAVARRAAPEKIAVISVLQSASAGQSGAVAQTLVDSGSTSATKDCFRFPQDNGGVDCLEIICNCIGASKTLLSVQ